MTEYVKDMNCTLLHCY